MNGFFERLKSVGRPAADSGKPCLTLAAFGKHPGWDDHMPGIGVETEALAYVEQTLYVNGIGRQVDSGAWEKLEPEKRLEGFDHILLWQRANHVLLGQLWSSNDRKGRSKYPMVLCVDGEGVSVDLVLEKVCAELEMLRGICKAAATAEQVIAECGASQDRLRKPSAPAESIPGMPVSVETRRRFLEHPDLGPERLGLLRVLHELQMASANDAGKRGSQTNENAVRSCHLRVPAADNSSTESLALWSAFFQSAAPKGAPILLISRKTTNWLDVVVGEPASDDFFCLGASLKALPLTTEIPYELSSESKSRLEKVTSRFLGEEPTKVVVEPRAFATAPVVSKKEVAEIPPSQKKHNLTLPLVLCAVILIGAGGLWLVSASRSRKPVAAGNNSSASVLSGTTPVKARETAKVNENYNAAMKDARAALTRQDYAVAIAKAEAALGFRKDDAAATKLKLDAQELQRAMEARALGEEKYQGALGAAQLAYDRKDYASAMSQADVALGIKPNDPAAAKLRTDAKAQLDLTTIVADQQRQKYEAAMKSAQAAFNRQDFSSAMAQADAALAVRGADPAATKLKKNAEAKIDELRDKEQRYQTAMKSSQAAFDRGDYATAVTQADAALAVRGADPAATKLKKNAEAKIDELRDMEQRYQAALKSGQAAFDRGDYATAVAQADAALAVRATDPAAMELQKKARDDKDLQDAQTCIDRGEFEKAKFLCSAHAGTPAFDELAGKVKAKEAARFDTELEVYLVRFGLLDPKKAKTNEARQETQWLGELPIQQRDQCLTDVEVLRKAFQSSDRLDTVREKQLNELKKAINNHL
jgi:hypothetical protein